MAQSQDTQVNLIINNVASEDLLKEMQQNNQLEANQIYETPDNSSPYVPVVANPGSGDTALTTIQIEGVNYKIEGGSGGEGIIDSGTITPGSTISGKNDTVVEYYVASDGNTWYRKWASGWKECGGVIARTTLNYNYEITFPITFTITPRCLSIQGLNLGSNTAVTWYAYQITNITINSMQLMTNTDFDRSWYACGY